MPTLYIQERLYTDEGETIAIILMMFNEASVQSYKDVSTLSTTQHDVIIHPHAFNKIFDGARLIQTMNCGTPIYIIENGQLHEVMTIHPDASIETDPPLPPVTFIPEAVTQMDLGTPCSR